MSVSTKPLSTFQSFGLAKSAGALKPNLFIESAWTNLPINPLEVLQNLLDLELKGRLIAAGEELDLSAWKGLASQWDLWPDAPNCQIRLDRKLVLHLLSQSLGEKANDSHFSCHSMTELEKEIVENLIQELIEHCTNNLRDFEEERRSNKIIHLIWGIETTGDIGKLCLSLPISHIPPVFVEEVRNEESCAEATIKINLQVGNSKMTIADLAAIEREDFIFLEDSDKSFFKILGMEGLDYAIPVVIGSQQKSPKLHKINLTTHELESMNSKPLSNDVLSNFPVEVKAEFRDVKVTLKDLFALQSGWVLPIDQVIDNELYLTSQGKTIAKGELVVAGDKFGILVKEVYLGNEETTDEYSSN